MKTFRLLTLEFILTLIGIILLGKLPYLLFDMDYLIMIQKAIDTGKIRNALYLTYDINLNWNHYFHQIIDTFNQVKNWSSLTYFRKGHGYPVFPDMWVSYLYSVKILGASFVLSIVLTNLFTFIIMLFTNSKIRRMLSSIIDTFQMIPDVFFILFVQFLIVLIYKRTDVLLFDILSFNGDNAYVLPVLCLSVLPTVFLTKTMLHLYEDELENRYVETAKAKGVRRSGILIIHIFRNTVASLFHHSKTIFWFSLSNLLMLEVLFNMNGITMFMWKYGTVTPPIFILGMLMLFLPFYLIFIVGGMIASTISKNPEGVFNT